MLNKTLLLLLSTAAAQQCETSEGCSSNWFETTCCQEPGKWGACRIACEDGHESQGSDTSATMIMQGFYFGATGEDSTCVAQDMAENDYISVTNNMESAGRYGTDNYYGSHAMVHATGLRFSQYSKQCESDWDDFWGEVAPLAQKALNTAVDICKVAGPVAEGVTLVAPENGVSDVVATTCEIMDGISDAETLIEEANNVINAVQDYNDCQTMKYAIQMFKGYKDEDLTDYTLGQFFGAVYKQQSGCYQFSAALNAALSGIPSSIGAIGDLAADAVTSVSLEQYDIKTGEQMTLSRRQLSTSASTAKPQALSNATQCQFCLSEADFLQFFQGVYDGQAALDVALPKRSVQECIQHTDDAKDIFTGQLQSKLTGLMLAHEYHNANETLRLVYELDELAFKVLGNSKCEDLNALAMLKLLEGKAPIAAKNQSLSMTTTEEVEVDLSGLPDLIARNNKKLVLAQSANATGEKGQYLHKMGQQLGLATKLYQLKGKEAPVASKGLDWQVTALIAGSVFVLIAATVFCFVKKHRRHGGAMKVADDEPTERSLTVNEN